MKRYKVTAKVDRPTTLEGLRRKMVGQTPVTEHVQVPVRPGCEFESDLDLQSYVNEGYVIEIADKPEQKPAAIPMPPTQVVPPTPAPADIAPATVADSDPPDEDEEDADDADDADDSDYDDTPEGGYVCLRCGKVYKPSSRALEFMENHIEKEHR